MSGWLIACGGTGGHLTPGIALAEGLAARGHRASLLISRKAVDARLAQKYPLLEFIPIDGTGLAWQPRALARFAWTQARSLRTCLRLVRTRRPAGIVAFGGFTSAGILLAGRWRGVPVALHESNRVPGRAIRRLGRLAQRVYLPPGVGLAGVPASRLRSVGMPVRAEIRRWPRELARRTLGLDPHAPVVVVFGGSQGAAPLNAFASRVADDFVREGRQLYCVTGPGKGAATRRTFATPGGGEGAVVFTPFCDEVAALLSAADLVVSRAGAGTLAELVRCQAPALLIPYPQAADNHQQANAAWLAGEGGARLLDQSRLEELPRAALAALADTGWQESCRAQLRRLDRLDPLMVLLDDLETLVSGAAPAAAPSLTT